jgi:ABC-2 type transport system ATP-binding protein
MPHPALSASNLTKRYGDVVAVDDLTFALEPGTITGFLGPNGAGKTTTLRLLLGLAEPTTGTALVFGRPYREIADPIRRVGAVLESGDFDPGRSGRNHLCTLALAGGIGFERADEVLALVELTAAADRVVRTYSLGMRQRLGLAGALLRQPRLLVLDEPTNGLDPQGIHEIRELLLALNAAGTTVFLSSHLLAEIEQMCTRVGVLDRGRLVLQDQLAELQKPTGRV